VVRHRQRPDVALIAVERFTVAGDFVGLLRKHVAHVTLEGLALTIPAVDQDSDDSPDAPDVGGRTRTERADTTAPVPLVLDELTADGRAHV